MEAKDVLKELRQRHNMTQDQLSEKLAVRTGGVPAGFRNSTLELIFCMFLFFCSIMLMMSSTYSAFIYMNF